MTKSKSSKKVVKSTMSDPLTKVKNAGILKRPQVVDAKTKDSAPKVASKEGKREKKTKKIKEPSPEPSSESEVESDSSASSSSSGSESEADVPAVKPVMNGKVNGRKQTVSESEDSAESAAEEDGKNGMLSKGAVGTVRATTGPRAGSSDGSEDESDDASGTSDDSGSDDETRPTTKTNAKIANGQKGTHESDSEADSESDSEADSEADSEDDDSEGSDEKAATDEQPIKRKAEKSEEPVTKKAKVDVADTARGSHLFVGNLSWNVDEAWLREVFEEHGELTGVRLMTDRATGRSKGFGYVEFVNANDAATAHGAKQGYELDGRTMNVDFANARPDNRDKTENRRKSFGDQLSEPSDTLFVGNISFDVGQEQVSEAFASQGTVLSIRLPTDRETGDPKGFGYVTFATVDEAKAALEAMQGAYVGNRPLRLDFSQPRPANGDFNGRGRGGNRGSFGSRGGRGGAGGLRGGSFGGRGGGFGGRGGSFGGRGGRGAGRGGSTNRGGFNDFAGRKQTFD